MSKWHASWCFELHGGFDRRRQTMLTGSPPTKKISSSSRVPVFWANSRFFLLAVVQRSTLSTLHTPEPRGKLTNHNFRRFPTRSQYAQRDAKMQWENVGSWQMKSGPVLGLARLRRSYAHLDGMVKCDLYVYGAWSRPRLIYKILARTRADKRQHSLDARKQEESGGDSRLRREYII